MPDNTHLLTDEQMKDFIVNGYISVHTNLPSSVHKNIYKQTKTVFEKEGNPGNNLLPRISAALARVPSFRSCKASISASTAGSPMALSP